MRKILIPTLMAAFVSGCESGPGSAPPVARLTATANHYVALAKNNPQVSEILTQTQR